MKHVKCGEEMIRAEGVIVSKDDGERILWRWYCPGCHDFPSGMNWDGERVVTVRVIQDETIIEYEQARTMS